MRQRVEELLNFLSMGRMSSARNVAIRKEASPRVTVGVRMRQRITNARKSPKTKGTNSMHSTR